MQEIREKVLFAAIQICIITSILYKHFFIIRTVQLNHDMREHKSALIREKEQLVHTLAFLYRHDRIQTVAQNNLNLKPISVHQIRYIPK